MINSKRLFRFLQYFNQQNRNITGTTNSKEIKKGSNIREALSRDFLDDNEDINRKK